MLVVCMVRGCVVCVYVVWVCVCVSLCDVCGMGVVSVPVCGVCGMVSACGVLLLPQLLGHSSSRSACTVVITSGGEAVSDCYSQFECARESALGSIVVRGVCCICELVR